MINVNQHKPLINVAIEACRAKSCHSLFKRLFREEGIPPKEIILGTKRLLPMKVQLEIFVSRKQKEK
ncbi:MAG: hypothetical protein ACFFCQ_14835 [Promethearchaeota archaeon]